MGLSNLFNMVRGDELIHALAKVKSFIPADRAKDIELKANQICIDLSPWVSNRNTLSYLEIIKTALQESKTISFRYIDRHGNKTKRTAEPYQLVLKGNHWYFQGYCYSRNDYRLFRLSRMTNLQMKKDTFVPRAYQKPILDIAEIVETLQIEIKIRIHKSIIDRILDFCDYEHFTADGDQQLHTSPDNLLPRISKNESLQTTLPGSYPLERQS